MPPRLTQKEFIERSVEIHKSFYSYSKVVFKNTTTLVKITCPVHGDFEQIPKSHLKGSGCQWCAGKKRQTTESMIKRYNKAHDNKYNYSLTKFTKSSEKIWVICPIHGKFEQVASAHLRQGCPSCGGTKKITFEEFLEKSNKIHENKYIYDKSTFKNINTPMKIRCWEHGEFKQTPRSHLMPGEKCPYCLGYVFDNVDALIYKFKKIHDDYYDYSDVVYTGAHNKIWIGCPIHGKFEQEPASHTLGSGCPKCKGKGPSKMEVEIFDFIKSKYPGKIIQNDREILDGKELDIFIPDLNIAFEINGSYYHSSRTKERSYHFKKWCICKSKNIGLMQIFDKDWIQKKDIIKSMILYKLNLSKSVFARKTQRREVDYREIKEFYKENHLQGHGVLFKKHNHWGLYHNEELVMALSFDKREIKRLCTKKGLSVPGGASKLFSIIPPGEYFSYCSNNLGGNHSHYNSFEILKIIQTVPGYYWAKGRNSWYSRHHTNKKSLKKLFTDYNGEPERVFMESKGFFKVYNAGNTKIIFKKY